VLFSKINRVSDTYVDKEWRIGYANVIGMWISLCWVRGL